MSDNDRKAGAVPAPREFESHLDEGWKRFVAHVVEHGFDVGERTPEDFIRHFPPAAIMNGLKDEAQLRANILVICTGIRQKIALKKSAESCGQDLQIALDEDEADAETIVTLFDPDDRVRYMDKEALWAYVTETKFWEYTRDKSASRHRRAANHMAFMIDRALEDELIDHQEVVEGITTDKISEHLPREALQQIIAGALEASHSGKPFSEKNLLDMCPAEVLTEHVPLPLIWEQVVAPQIAARHKLAPGPVPKPSASVGDDDDDQEEEDLEAAAESGATSEGETADAEADAEPNSGDEGSDDGSSDDEDDDEDLDMDIDDVLNG